MKKLISVLIGFSAGMLVYSLVGIFFTRKSKLSKKYRLFFFSFIFLVVFLIIVWLKIK